MKTSLKKIFALLLTIIVVIGVVSIGAFSVETDKEANPIADCEVGDIIEFGSYPQSKVTDEETLNGIKSVEDNYEWVSYNYYSGEGYRYSSSIVSSDYMKYRDISYNGDKYRAVLISDYRPEFTGGTHTPVYPVVHSTYQISNGYEKDNVYYFKYEPLKWQVLDPSEGFVMCANVIDSQAFNNYCIFMNNFNGNSSYDDDYYGDSTYSFYASDWEKSSLRTWLNDDFYNTAFTSSEQSLIITSNLQNKSSYKRWFDCADTQDKIFLLSRDDALNRNYGFSTDYLTEDKARQMKPTDYARCQGSFTSKDSDHYGTSYWWLRSPYNSKYACDVHCSGTVDSHMTEVCATYHGILPAFKFDMETEKICDEHIYNSSVTKEATCTEKGIRTYICSVCGDSYTEEIELAEHNLNHVTESATCEKAGAEYDLCSVCGAKFNEESIPVTEHNYVPAITKEATCTEKGIRTYTCSVCGDSYTEEIEFAEHNLNHVTESATCEKAGAEYYLCSVCGAKFNEESIPVAEHNYVPAVTKEATCTEKGIRTYTCSVCGDSYTEEIELAEHNLNHVTESATCEKAGAEYDLCSVCGAKFNEESIPVTEHKYVPAITKESTCTEKGIRTYTCSVCGDSYTEEIALAEHQLVHYVEKPACAESGKEYDICTVCEETFNTKEIEPAGHKYENGICTVCGKTENWDYIISRGTVTVTSYTGHDKYLDIPAEINGYPVTEIAESAYAGNTELEYVSIPNSVFVIGENAFRGCTNLKEICISDSVSTISEGAFADCSSLAIVFIASVNTALKGAFSNNSSRLSFIVPENTRTSANVQNEGLSYNTYMYPKEKDGKGAIAVKGTVTLYEDLEYNYWSKLIEKYPYAFYLYFDSLVFDGVEEDEIILIDDSHIDSSSKFLTMNEVYISINVDGRCVTFRELIDMLRKGKMEAVITFADSQGVTRTFLQKIGDFFEDVFNVISKAINAIVRIFKK